MIASVDLDIWLADLTYTQPMVATDTLDPRSSSGYSPTWFSMPFAIGGIATFAEMRLDLPSPIRLFKYPDRLAAALRDDGIPDVIGFSCYIWNSSLAGAFARVIKERSPKTVVVMGGPHYPIEEDEKKTFLRDRPFVDFFVHKEGELAFAKLIEALGAADMDTDAVKRLDLPSIHSIDASGNAHLTPLLDRIDNLSAIPSPYSTGRLDEFFDGTLMPAIQTNRGCPFACTFCVEGVDYYNKVHHSTAEKIATEIDAIGSRMVKCRKDSGRNDLFIVDTNFGMYQEDLDTCRQLAHARERYQWPGFIYVDSGKNNKERVVEASRILDGDIRVSGTVQSLDPTVLENVKRSNISVTKLLAVANEATTVGANSYSELILGLPGDSLEAHRQSVKEVMEAGFTRIYCFPLMVLVGSEIGTQKEIDEYDMDIRYRVLPRCFGSYEVLGENVVSAEIEEACVANSTMSFEDYLECRRLYLFITVFYNDSVFASVLKLLKLLGLSAWRWTELLIETEKPPRLEAMLEEFENASRDEFSDTREDLEAFIQSHGTAEKLVSSGLGSNLVFSYNRRALVECSDELATVARRTSVLLLAENGVDSPENVAFVKELIEFQRLSMTGLLREGGEVPSAMFRYDIEAFSTDLKSKDIPGYKLESPTLIEFLHDDRQRELISRNVERYGKNPKGLGRMLSRMNTREFFRRPMVATRQGT